MNRIDLPEEVIAHARDTVGADGGDPLAAVSAVAVWASAASFIAYLLFSEGLSNFLKLVVQYAIRLARMLG